MDERVRAVSYGGGVQSTSLLVLAATGIIDYHTFLFANVGDDSEDPLTLAYVRDVARPYAEAAGIEIVEVRYKRRDGTMPTLREHIMDGGRFALPAFMMPKLAPGNRTCTKTWKAMAVAAELRKMGATSAEPALVAIGISVDEMQRAKPGVDKANKVQDRTYPLLDLSITRTKAKRIITDAGLPVPPKSACYFCPYHTNQDWHEMKRDRPELFAGAVEMEDAINTSRAELHRQPVYFSKRPAALSTLGEAQDTLFADGDDCDSGWCFT